MSAPQSEPSSLASSLSGENIAKMLRTEGPVVTCVLLRATPADPGTCTTDTDAGDCDTEKSEEVEAKQELKPAAESSSSSSSSAPRTKEGDESKSKADMAGNGKPVLTHLISELPVDTTPKKSMVSLILGGPFTFLGQYEQEGTMVMVRQQPEFDGDTLEDEALLPKTAEGMGLNPHELQPPLHNYVVYGDILLMRVAPCAEDEEVREEETADKTKVQTHGSDNSKVGEGKGDQTNNAKGIEEDTNKGKDANAILSNEEFFLNYTKEEYIQFASRTDIVFNEPEEQEEQEQEQEFDSDERVEDQNEGSGSDEEYQLGGSDDEFGSDEEDEGCQIGMMNLILAQIIKRFREEHSRGPDTDELLAMRSALAEKLGIQCDAQNGDVLELSNGSESFQLQDVMGGGAEGDTEESKDSSNGITKTIESKKRKAEPSASTDITEDGSAEKRVKFSAKNEIKILPIISAEDYEDETDEKPQDFQIIREEDSNYDSNAIQDDEASI